MTDGVLVLCLIAVPWSGTMLRSVLGVRRWPCLRPLGFTGPLSGNRKVLLNFQSWHADYDVMISQMCLNKAAYPSGEQLSGLGQPLAPRSAMQGLRPPSPQDDLLTEARLLTWADLR